MDDMFYKGIAIGMFIAGFSCLSGMLMGLKARKFMDS